MRFFSSDEPADRELPPVGPLDNVVLRRSMLVAERRLVHQAQELGVAIDRWLEAELEMQRATGEEPGGNKRDHFRFTAIDGVYVRFTVFGHGEERDSLPELGPFTSVVVTPRRIEADRVTLATRAGGDVAPWDLTTAAGASAAGLHKPDLAFRTSNTTYHPSINAAPAAPAHRVTPVFMPPRVEPVLTPPPRIDPVFTPPPRADPVFVPPPRIEPVFTPPPRIEFTPPPRADTVVTPSAAADPVGSASPPQTETLFIDRPRKAPEVYSPQAAVAAARPEIVRAPAILDAGGALARKGEDSLRARIKEGERTPRATKSTQEQEIAFAARYRPQPVVETSSEAGTSSPREWGAALWRLRFAVIGVLILGVALYGFITLRTGTAPSVGGTQQFRSVGIADRFGGTRWDFVINGVQRSSVAGTNRARGVYYAVRVAATNKGADGQQLSPGDFTLVDASGTEYAPEGIATGTYQTPGNPGSPYLWPETFPPGKAATFSVVFDVDPSLPRGMLLKISDTPTVRVRLD
ncbi:MAG TPA: hypothetical protein VM052_01565 [Candidatus Limnocylindrales bacterium]|nr:hypothetical protein [Candidatus Limnocylindrales bacterium]